MVRKSEKLQSDPDIFDGDMTSSVFDMTSSIVRCHDSLIRSDMDSKLYKLVFFSVLYVLLEFQDDWSSRKTLPFHTHFYWKWHFLILYGVIASPFSFTYFFTHTSHRIIHDTFSWRK